MSAAVVRAGDRAEALLARGVPLYRKLSVSLHIFTHSRPRGGKSCVCTHDLQFHGLAVELDGPDLEVHADGRDVALSVGVVRETEQKA